MRNFFTIQDNELTGEFECQGKSTVQLIVNGCIAKPAQMQIDLIKDKGKSIKLSYPFKKSDFVEIYLPNTKTYLTPVVNVGFDSGFITPPGNSLRIGVGLVTYNRLDYVKGFIDKLNAFDTNQCVELVVADDGSKDQTVEWCKKNQIKVVTGRNKGVAWNKNRALYYLANKELDVILLIEDDCWPKDHYWMSAWAGVVNNFQHVNFGHPVILRANKAAIQGGDGSAKIPFLTSLVTGQCTGVTRKALQQVGYLDSRFKGFGGAHVEWSFRFNKLFPVSLNDQQRLDLFATFRGGLVENDAPTFRDEDQVKRNRALRKKMANDQVFKMPWRNLWQKLEFLWEQSKV